MNLPTVQETVYYPDSMCFERPPAATRGLDRSAVDLPGTDNQVDSGRWGSPFLATEGSNLPATNMSHWEALAFCRKLTEQEKKAGRLRKGWKYALPTEA